jgi:hypothetical protein
MEGLAMLWLGCLLAAGVAVATAGGPCGWVRGLLAGGGKSASKQWDSLLARVTTTPSDDDWSGFWQIEGRAVFLRLDALGLEAAFCPAGGAPAFNFPCEYGGCAERRRNAIEFLGRFLGGILAAEGPHVPAGFPTAETEASLAARSILNQRIPLAGAEIRNYLVAPGVSEKKPASDSGIASLSETDTFDFASLCRMEARQVAFRFRGPDFALGRLLFDTHQRAAVDTTEDLGQEPEDNRLAKVIAEGFHRLQTGNTHDELAESELWLPGFGNGADLEPVCLYDFLARQFQAQREHERALAGIVLE